MRDPNIFLSQRPFDSIAKIISPTLPVNWQIVIENPDLESERPLRDKVLNFVEQSTHFIVIWSQESRISSLVNQEIGVALHKRIPVIALVERGVTLEAILERIFQNLKIRFARTTTLQIQSNFVRQPVFSWWLRALYGGATLSVIEY